MRGTGHSNREQRRAAPRPGTEPLWSDPRPSPVTIDSMYSPQLLDHFQNPRNAGDLPDADAIVELENPACGDVIRLSLKFRAGRIEGVRFKAKGCVPSMACGSALTELIQGKTLTEAYRLNRGDLVALVGDLPQASSHAAQLALDALKAALAKLEGNFSKTPQGS